MNWESVVDTFLNVTVFVFIGVLVWMYLKQGPHDQRESSDRD